MLNRDIYFSLLKSKSVGRTLVSFESLGSTNDYLKQKAAELPHGAAVTADTQTGGRGRRGHTWNTHPGCSLAISILLKPVEMRSATIIPLLCANAAAKACALIGVAEARIKWPNDVVWRGRKLGGILCESVANSENCAIICGIGLNLLQNEEFFKARGLDYAASVKTACGRSASAEEAAASLCGAIEEEFEKYAAGKNEAILCCYREKCVTIGKEVTFEQNGAQRSGTAETVGSDGSLLVRSGDDLIRLNAGEVSVRGVYGYL